MYNVDIWFLIYLTKGCLHFPDCLAINVRTLAAFLCYFPPGVWKLEFADSCKVISTMFWSTAKSNSIQTLVELYTDEPSSFNLVSSESIYSDTVHPRYPSFGPFSSFLKREALLGISTCLESSLDADSRFQNAAYYILSFKFPVPTTVSYKLHI